MTSPFSSTDNPGLLTPPGATACLPVPSSTWPALADLFVGSMILCKRSFESETDDPGESGSRCGGGVSLDGPAIAFRFVVILTSEHPFSSSSDVDQVEEFTKIGCSQPNS